MANITSKPGGVGDGVTTGVGVTVEVGVISTGVGIVVAGGLSP